MTDGNVGWRFLDVDSGLVPEDFSASILPGGGVGRIVALAATPSAREGGWATRAVVAIAREWAQQDLRIFLMDLGLDAPSLHAALGLKNGEGVSDAFLYGASVQRIAQPALNDSIFFASAGTVTADPEQILGHPRWNDLAGGFSEADATLLLFLPTELPGAEEILSRATDVLLLAEEGESPDTHLGPAAVKAVAVLGPMPSHQEREVIPESGSRETPEDRDPLAGGFFGLAADTVADDGDSEVGSDYGFEETLSLAEGFTRELKIAGSPDLPDTVEGTEDFDLDQRPEEEPEAAPDLPADETISEQEGESELTDETVLSGPPDFGAEFADMPPLEHERPVVDSQDGLSDDFRPGSGLSSEEETESRRDDVDEDGVLDRAGAPDSGKRPPFRPDRPKPGSRRKPPPKKRLNRPILAGIATAVVILIAAGGTALGFFSVPGFAWLQGSSRDVPQPDLAREGPEPTGPVLRFSLELETYGGSELQVALEMRNALKDRLPDLVFHLSPMASDGLISYALQAGPAADMIAVENLRGPLAEVMTREDPESWPIRSTPRGFLLGTEATREEAEAFLADAEERGALGYVLPVAYSDGSEAYEILSGAFQGTQDARWWQLELRRSGFPDVPLVERRGRSPE